MSVNYEFNAPDLFTAGAVGPPGQRVFYLQARENNVVATLKLEKEHVAALGEHLATILEQLPEPVAARENLGLLEPVEPDWAVATIRVGYDEAAARIVIEAIELLEDEESADQPATARFRVSAAQAATFAETARTLMKAGRPICPMCTQPKDPEGHLCPRANGHMPGRA
jgi:uncharacterized repeat protein (TIGR03847 family)